MNAKILEARRSADLYIATGTPVAASLVISICDQLDEAKESINALTLALEVERDAANLYAKQVAHWIGRYDALLEQQLAPSVPQEWNDKNVMAWCVARGIKEAQPSEPAQPVAQPNIQNQIVKDISRHEPCHTCAHYQQGKLPGVRIHDETCYECRSYWGNKWEAA